MDRDTEVASQLRERRASRADLERLLADLETRPVTGALTRYVRPGETVLLPGSGASEALERLYSRVGASETGSVMFSSDSGTVAVLPPFPVINDLTLDGCDPAELRAMIRREYVVGVVLLRLGRYAVGVFRGRTLVSSKTNTRYVKGRHSAGGTSQKRFERIRDKQVQQIFDKTCSVARTQLGPYEGELDYILLGGERFTLQGFLKRCDYLQRLSPRTLGRVLNVREPKRQALEGVAEAIYESRVLNVG